MLALIFLLTATGISFFLIPVLMWLAEARKNKRRTPRPTPIVEPPPPILLIEEAFDPVFAVLWEAPISALQLVESAGPAGLRPARLLKIFKSAATSFPEIYDGYTFLQWLACLEAIQFISWRGERLLLAPEGRAFLKYRFVTEAMVAA